MPLVPAHLPLQSPLRQIGPDYLSDRSSTITPYQSNLIVGGLRQIGMLSNEGWLLADPHDFDVSIG
jgi:hypothetical protein